MKALYYPHTEIHSETILKNTLLLWDSVETIVPTKKWVPKGLPSDKIFREAYDLVVQHRVPSSAEQRATHEEIKNLARNGVLQRLASDPFKLWRSSQMLIYPQKFLHMTWSQLAHTGLADWDTSSDDYAVPSGIGFMMMSVLADACAGTQIHKITDRGEAYSFISAKSAESLGAQRITGLDPMQIAPAYDRLAEISISVLDARKISLKKLLALRKREAKAAGSDLQRLRHQYHESLKKHIEQIGKEAKTASDVKELEQAFRTKVSNDLADLKSELGVAKTDTLFSKDVVVPAVFVAGLAIAPALAATGLAQIGWAGVIPLANAIRTYRNKEKDILRKHQMSWLYMINKR